MKIQQERFVEHGRGARRMSGAQQGSPRQRNAEAVLSAGLGMTGSESPRSCFGSVQSERLSRCCPFPLAALTCSAAP
jgi:hypothetical protein